jgi:nitrite reductase/ring-hydroxylating ferredoxin subunit
MALTRDQQEFLVRVGPQTPMGELLRRYWVPVLLADELPEPDCPPVRVRILGEDLIAFRDTDGRIGLVDEFCPHRGVSFYFGRNEECGLRCSYHGWKFDVDGKCVDMPSEPEESAFRNKVQITAYPCVERGDLVFAYLGPPEHRPAPPEIEWLTVPASYRCVHKRMQYTNWVQALEGGIDSSHVSVLHRYDLDGDRLHLHSKGSAYLKGDTRPKFEVAETEWGLSIGARRNADAEHYYWRITPFIMPWYTIIPPYADHPTGGHAFVPIDDENCWVFSMYYSPDKPIPDELRTSLHNGSGNFSANIPGTFIPRANRTNDYLIDRKAQKEKKTFSGVMGIGTQDQAVQESMGPIQDRTRERLGTSDSGVIAARARLMNAAVALRDQGTAPPALEPEQQRVRSTSIVLPRSVPFAEGAREAMAARPGTPLVSI